MSTTDSTATVIGINGNLVSAELHGPAILDEVGVVACGDERLLAEVIRIDGSIASLQVFEDTRGIRVGTPVALTGELLSVTLGPGMLGSIYDGLQRPLPRLRDRDGYFLRRGASAPALDVRNDF